MCVTVQQVRHVSPFLPYTLRTSPGSCTAHNSVSRFGSERCDPSLEAPLSLGSAVRAALPSLALGLLALVPIVPGTPLLAQEGDGLQPDDRIRLYPAEPGAEMSIHRFRSVRRDTLFLRGHGENATVSLHLSAVRRLEVSRGEPSRAASTVIGAAAGGAVGAVVGAIVGSGIRDMPRWQGPLMAGGAGAVVGGVVGYIAGSGERWERVPLLSLRERAGAP